MRDRPDSPDASIGVPPAHQGLVLQRGGEELVLEKVSDRFTLRTVNDFLPKQLSRPTWGNWQCSIPQGQLELFTVAPKKLDGAMSMARSSENVAFASHVYQIPHQPGSQFYLTDQITVQFATWVDGGKIQAIANNFGLLLEKALPDLPNTFVFTLGSQAKENPLKITNQLIALPEVMTAEPNIIVHQELHYQPRDPLYPQQWYLQHQGGNQLAQNSHISVESAWDITRGIRSVVIAVVDDSFDLNHPDFQGNGKIVAPRDLRENDFLPLPGEQETSHGTACAGVALAEENGTGIVGVAPGCALMPIRTTGYLDDESVEAIFSWAVEKGASIISCSWGASAVYFPLSLRQKAAITRAATKGRTGKGCVILFAAGNANRPVSGSINEQGWVKNILKGDTKWLNGFAVHPDVITIAASTSLGKKAAYSNWGTSISVCAPSNNAPPGMWFQEMGYIFTQPAINANLAGLGVFTSDQLGAAGYDAGDFTRNFGGTSSATPVVAGVVGLILSANPDLTAQQVKRILQETADKIIDPDPDPQLGSRYGTYNQQGFSQWFGYGKVNAWRAVEAAQRLRANISIATQQIGGANYSQLPIPDNNRQGLKSPILIESRSPQTTSESTLVKDIQVTVNITHEFLGDLEIYLIAPNNNSVLLQSRTLGRRQQLQAIYTVRSHPVLEQLLNQKASGRWQLWVIDQIAEDIGRLNSWELSLGI
ncbi:S8 family serine peptidase [Calothrix sp. 336/3]|uniref:S8 family serine peptidase n=1 Tax=Calothrix sp. 336/3 TaxID=1337936 RepID=UPI0004E30419|nr:S8 family serine peptidase [Calothrix sp. 336/3]AKG21959.1 peptidase S8 [Calothrix sp. 336/3]